MKKLKKILLINWLYFSKQLIEVDDINFLTGKNGAGKSTVIDALQIVLLGETNSRNFNQAANEKSQRTLDGYLRADMDENSPYSRRGKDFSSYIACEFFDETEGTSFVTGVVFDCRSDGTRQERFFIYDGVIPENCFLENQEAMDISRLRRYLKELYGTGAELYDTQKQYRVNMVAKWNVQNEQVCRMLKKAVSFRPIVDIQKFITENITRGARKSMSFLQYQKESPEFLNNYLKYKRYIDFGAQTTIDETFYDLRCLFRYIKLYLNDRNKLNSISKEDFRNIEITDVTIADLERMNQNDLTNYLFFLDNTLENISKTRNRKLASMKRLYEYLETNNLINVNPTKWMQSATIEKRQPKYLDLNESKQLLANAINSDCRYKIRNYAITCLFLNCSLRLSELVGINLSDLKIDNSEQTLKVTGKGNKQRIIYLNSAVCEAINAYIKIRPKLDKSNKDYNALFLSSRGKRISKRSVQNIIKSELVELVEAEGKESKKYHTHTLRHTGATLLYNEANANIFVLKIILGHESLDATQVYTHVSDKKLKELMQNFNILDRKE